MSRTSSKSILRKIRKSAKSYRKSSPKMVNKTMRKYVKATVNRAIMKKSETKINFINAVNQKFNATISSTGDLYNLLPSLAQGTGDDQRVGNTVIPMYTNVRGYVSISTNDALYGTLGPLDVQLFCLRNKTRRDGSSVKLLQDLDIIKRGTSKQTYDGTFASSISPVNTEDFQILFKKSFRLIPIPTTSSSSTSAPTSFSLPNNSNSGSTIYKFKHTINWKKVGVKKLIYEISGSSQPCNENIYWCLGYAQYNDPNNAVSDTYTPVQMTMQAITYYKDM